jgi:hypothetical protein
MKKTIAIVFEETKKALKRKNLICRLLESRIPGIQKEELDDLFEKLSEDFTNTKEQLQKIISEEITTLPVQASTDYSWIIRKGTDHTQKEYTVAQLLAKDFVRILFPFEGVKKPADLILDTGNEIRLTEAFILKLNRAIMPLELEVLFIRGEHRCFLYRRKKISKAA